MEARLNTMLLEQWPKSLPSGILIV